MKIETEIIFTILEKLKIELDRRKLPFGDSDYIFAYKEALKDFQDKILVYEAKMDQHKNKNPY